MPRIDASLALRRFALCGAAFVAAILSPAHAAGEPSTRLVSCGPESCLLIAGRRANAAAAVYINGRSVAVEGARKWRVRVPLTSVREWSAPFARTITVSVDGASAEADLPLGLLRPIKNFAMLTVTAK